MVTQLSFCTGGKRGLVKQANVSMSICDSEVWLNIRNKQDKKRKYIRPELMLLIMTS